jgi:hypothetical protein
MSQRHGLNSPDSEWQPGPGHWQARATPGPAGRAPAPGVSGSVTSCRVSGLHWQMCHEMAWPVTEPFSESAGLHSDPELPSGYSDASLCRRPGPGAAAETRSRPQGRFGSDARGGRPVAGVPTRRRRDGAAAGRGQNPANLKRPRVTGAVTAHSGGEYGALRGGSSSQTPQLWMESKVGLLARLTRGELSHCTWPRSSLLSQSSLVQNISSTALDLFQLLYFALRRTGQSGFIFSIFFCVHACSRTQIS